MNTPNSLREVLADDLAVRWVEDGIYSVVPDVSRKHRYDRKAAVYDLVVGAHLYNSVMWGTSPVDYADFAQQAAISTPEGRFLDAGCGSLLFTWPIYLECDRQIVALDQSLAMLRRARKRLLARSGLMPDNILLLQADLNDLPFRPASFSTALCLNVLHQFERADALISRLNRLLAHDGQLYLTSLISNNRFVGDHYLNVLHAAGEFVRPRGNLELREIVDKSLRQE